MPVRDRLAELQKGLKRSDKKVDEKSSVSDGAIDGFLKKVEKIDEQIKNVRGRLVEVERQQQNILCSPGYNRTLIGDLQKNTNWIRGELSAIQKEVREVERVRESESEESVEASNNNALARIKSQQVTRLVSSLTAVSNEYFHLQAQYSAKMKERLNRQQNIAQGITDDRLTLTEAEAMEMVEKNASVFTQDFVSNVEEAQAALNQIEERHKDILKLEKSVADVNELFKDISILITEQGETIDNIESHVQTTTVLIKDGNEQLEQANKHRKRSRRCCIIIVVVVIIGIGILLAAILPSVL